MKFKQHLRAREEGSVLAVTLIFCVVLGILMASYLWMVQTQHRSVARAQAWNAAMVIAEAGVEEGMAHLNSGVIAPNLAANTWQAIAPGIFQKTNNVGTNYSVVLIKVPPATTDPNPTIVSTGYMPVPLSNQKVSRTVQVRTKPKPDLPLPAAMVVSTSVSFNGFNISTDSFNSTDTNYSTGGTYDPAKASDKGNVVSLSTVPGSVQIGNAKVKGTIHVPPNMDVNVGAGGSVGDMDWVNGGQKGVQDGHVVDDVNLTFPDPVLPPANYWLSPVPGNYKIKGVNYKYVLNASSPWKLDSLDGGVYVNGSNVVLYVTDSISLGSKMEIRIAANSSFKLYMAGANADVSGSGIINETGLAKNFTYYGLPSNKTLKFGAQVGFVGTIYAPQTVFSLGGGGKNIFDFIGASITKSATMNGHYNFHYDEGLPTSQPGNGYLAVSWDEL
jgi:Tfp pilus assembly protein PilX